MSKTMEDLEKDGWKATGVIERNKVVIKEKIESVIKEYAEIMKIKVDSDTMVVMVNNVKSLINTACLEIVKKKFDAQYDNEEQRINKEIESGEKTRPIEDNG